jgi:hypothetical protein
MDRRRRQPGPEAILPTYEREAADWARGRNLTMWEAPALLAAVDGRAPGLAGARPRLRRGGADRRVVRRARRPGDGGRRRGGDDRGVPRPRAGGRGDPCRHAGPALGRRFDVILAFNSFFHLSPTISAPCSRSSPPMPRRGRRCCSPADPRRARSGGGRRPRRSTTPRSTRRSTGRACRSPGSPRSGSGRTTRSSGPFGLAGAPRVTPAPP